MLPQGAESSRTRTDAGPSNGGEELRGIRGINWLEPNKTSGAGAGGEELRDLHATASLATKVCVSASATASVIMPVVGGSVAGGQAAAPSAEQLPSRRDFSTAQPVPAPEPRFAL